MNEPERPRHRPGDVSETDVDVEELKEGTSPRHRPGDVSDTDVDVEDLAEGTKPHQRPVDVPEADWVEQEQDAPLDEDHDR